MSPSRPIQIDVNDHTDVPMANASDFAVMAEQGGIDGVGVHDHQGSGHDVFVRLNLIANATSRVTVFPSVTNPITRHPAVLAAAANSLAELAPGRIRIMLGSGDLATSAIGQRAATVAWMRESTLAMRALLAGESATLGGTAIRKLGHVANDPPAVYVNASSPRMLETAGDVADGVYAMVGVRPEVVERAREHIATGEKRAGRSPGNLPVAHGVPIYMGLTREAALEGMRAYAYSNLSKPRKVFATVMREFHPDLHVPNDAAALTEVDLATIADALGIVGTPVECGERLAEFVSESGVDHIVCRIFFAGADPMTALAVLIKDVLPALNNTTADLSNSAAQGN